MSTDRPCDQSGNVLDRMDAHELRRSSQSSRVNRVEAIRGQLAVQRSNLQNLVTATGLELADARRDFEKRLAAERAARLALERQIESLRGELATAQRLADLAARLDRIEGVAPPAERSDAPSPRTSLRLAGQSLIA